MYPPLSIYRGGGAVPRPPLPPPPPGVYTQLPYGGHWQGSTYVYGDGQVPVSRDFLIADAWGITLDGLPFVPGGSSRQPSQNRFLSWFFGRYPTSYQDQWLQQNVLNGNTHAIVSPPDDLQGFGMSLQQTIDLYGRIKTKIPYVHVMLGSKLYQPWNMGVQQYCDYAFPLIDAYVAAGVVDEVCPAWEMDLWNVSGAPTDVTGDICRAIGQRAHAAGVGCWLHFSSHVTYWPRAGQDRFSWWTDLGGAVDGIDYQGDPNWLASEWQARIVDTLHQFGQQGNVHKLRAFERKGDLMFDNPTPTEADANLDGYLSLCTIDDVNHTSALVWGSAQGPCHLDGTPL